MLRLFAYFSGLNTVKNNNKTSFSFEVRVAIEVTIIEHANIIITAFDSF